jgi:hypothetical protein
MCSGGKRYTSGELLIIPSIVSHVAESAWITLDLTTNVSEISVKQRDDKGNLIGIKVRVIYGDDTTLTRTGEHTVHVERTNLTSRHMIGRLVRKTLGFSKRLEMLKASRAWEDVVYNLTRSVKSLRLEVNNGNQRWFQCSPAIAAELTDHIWSIREVLTHVPIPTNSF